MSLEIRAGQLWAVIGRNGGGKTTLLRTLLGLLPPVAGQRSMGRDVAYVPQRGVLVSGAPSRVIDVVRGGVERGRSFLRPLLSSAERERITRAVRDAQVEELSGRQVAELSEGQKQRVLLARALASDPRLLVLDEPTAAMDHVAEAAVFDRIDELRRARGVAVVVVAHQLPLLTSRASHAVLVDADEKVVLCGELARVAAEPAFRRRYGVLP